MPQSQKHKYKEVLTLAPMQQVATGFRAIAEFVADQLIKRKELHSDLKKEFIDFQAEEVKKNQTLNAAAIEIYNNDRQVVNRTDFHGCAKSGKLKPKKGCLYCSQIAFQMKKHLPTFLEEQY